MKTILITGGTGFIGNHLCRSLLNNGHRIICVDNNSTGHLSNISDCFNDPNFTFIDYDITLPIKITENIDIIFHLACPASPPAYQKDPIKTLDTCFLGTKNILELAKNKNARILLTSTSEVYGDPNISPQNEEYRGNVNPIGIRACYDEGKRIAETLMFEYHRVHNVDIRVVRIFNTYGPNMDPNDGRVVSNFINQCIRNENITIYGDGSQTRSFCYVSDLVEGLIKMMDTPNISGPINLGNPMEWTIKKLAETVKNMTNSKSELIYLPLPSDDPLQRKPDIFKANSILNWYPKVDINEGLMSTIKYFSNLI